MILWGLPAYVQDCSVFPREALSALVSFQYNHPITKSDAWNFCSVFMVPYMMAVVLLYSKVRDKHISYGSAGADGSFLYVDHLTIWASRLQMGFNLG